MLTLPVKVILGVTGTGTAALGTWAIYDGITENSKTKDSKVDGGTSLEREDQDSTADSQLNAAPAQADSVSNLGQGVGG